MCLLNKSRISDLDNRIGVESEVGLETMASADDIRSAIGEYLVGDSSFGSLQDWLIANTRNIHRWGDPQSKYLAYFTHLLLSEYLVSDENRITEDNLRAELKALANTYLTLQNMTIVTGTSTKSVVPLGLKSPPAGRLFVGAYELLASR